MKNIFNFILGAENAIPDITLIYNITTIISSVIDYIL